MQSFWTSNREVDNDAIRVERLSLNSRVETAGGNCNFELLILGQFPFQVFDKDVILRNNQNFRHYIVYEFAERHPMFFQELNQIFARNTTIL